MNTAAVLLIAARACAIDADYAAHRPAPETCERRALLSSWIAWAAWCPGEIMLVQVTSGHRREYRYARVPRAVFEALTTAQSAGRAFAREKIAERFACARAPD